MALTKVKGSSFWHQLIPTRIPIILEDVQIERQTGPGHPRKPLLLSTSPRSLWQITETSCVSSPRPRHSSLCRSWWGWRLPQRPDWLWGGEDRTHRTQTPCTWWRDTWWNWTVRQWGRTPPLPSTGRCLGAWWRAWWCRRRSRTRVTQWEWCPECPIKPQSPTPSSAPVYRYSNRSRFRDNLL